MVLDRIEAYLKKIIDNTKLRRIRWRPFEEYYQSKEFNDEMWISFCNEFTEIIFSDSFYAKKGDVIIFVVTSKWISGEDGSVSYHKDILVSCSDYCDTICIPEYATTKKDKLVEAVKEYWFEKCSDYNQEISDIFDVLDVFAEG